MTREEYLEIRALHDQGLTTRAIARRLGVHRRKIRAALTAASPPKRETPRRGSQVDAHRGWLLAKLQLYPELSAARLYRMLREQGYAGGYTLVKQAVAELRPRLQPVYETLHFEPGAAAQVDWGVWQSVNVLGGVRRLSFFTLVLCHSRMLYAEFFCGETLEFWLTAHRHAFEYLAGVPATVIVDNCKTAVLQPRRHGQEPILNEAYADFARHYGFTVTPCTPGRPNEKGRVEKAVGYVRTAFLAARPPNLPEVLNPALRHWLDTEANCRRHGTTQARPLDLYLSTEKAALQPLPATPHACTVHQPCLANSACRVTCDANRYSIAPEFAGQRLQLFRDAERLVIRATDGQLAGSHLRRFTRGQSYADPAHQEAVGHLNRRAHQNRQLAAFLRLGSVATEYLAGLKDKRPDYLNHVRQINAQREIFGHDAVARALADAHEHRAYAADYILHLLHARSRGTDPATGPLHVTRRADLLDLSLPEPDLSRYDSPPNPQPEAEDHGRPTPPATRRIEPHLDP